MAKKRAAQKAPKGASASSGDNSTLLAFIGVFLAVVGFLIVYLVKKEDDYAMHYAKQGLALFIVAVIVWVASRVLMIVPVLGSIVSTVLGMISSKNINSVLHWPSSWGSSISFWTSRPCH
ncbi:MAG: hypothetical protein QT04_C0060G0007 [archaeon GW2011_AR11]|nr:MAG: hypothetical protein QT04_C0060G0007 [archaeon GW2011_AR11]